ncbi:DUF2975 domain-containing protein [Amnibacterium flavum]|uniref:DUF2975 domain-containing protein n=1 Tax=Amnibacterium flavum TaxID=2173173 RepID=A0A2V1HL68_9MICO|nr:DUF2975 domain-containing protein [Amnibacterium flavum]PVZ93386.1 hypothetical protein DDQ50_15535 [Amnibacterium flavum]
MSRLAILALRFVILVIAIGAIGAQAFIVPVIAAVLAGSSDHPEVGLPYTVVGIAIIACVEIALVAVWVLLSMVHRGRIFVAHAFGWVDTIVWAAAAATVLVAGLGAHIYFVVEPVIDAPGVILVLFCLTILGGGFTLLLVVMRSLLQSATALQSELEEVV